MIPTNSASNQRLHVLYPRMSKGAKLSMEKAPKNLRKALRLNAHQHAILQKTLNRIEQDEKRVTAILDEKCKAFLRRPSVGPVTAGELQVSNKCYRERPLKTSNFTGFRNKLRRNSIGFVCDNAESRARFLRDSTQSRVRFVCDSTKSQARLRDISLVGLLRDSRNRPICVKTHPKLTVEARTSLEPTHLKTSVSRTAIVRRASDGSILLPPVNRPRVHESRPPNVHHVLKERHPEQTLALSDRRNQHHYLPSISHNQPACQVKGIAIKYNVR